MLRHCKVYRCAVSLIGNPYFGKSCAVNLNHAYEELQDLVERVEIELELINVAKGLDG